MNNAARNAVTSQHDVPVAEEGADHRFKSVGFKYEAAYTASLVLENADDAATGRVLTAEQVKLAAAYESWSARKPV